MSFFFSSRRRHTRFDCDWSSDVCSSDLAAITGDFVLVDKEVNPVALTLRQHGIDVTALHNHGLQDTPRLFYMHFWANDDPVKLAQGLKAALELTNSKKAEGTK